MKHYNVVRKSWGSERIVGERLPWPKAWRFAAKVGAGLAPGPRRPPPCRREVTVFDVLIRVWDPIRSKLGKVEERANREPLTEPEADAMVADLLPCVDDYQGQGQTLHGVRKAARVRP